MKFSLKAGNPTKMEMDILIIPIFENDTLLEVLNGFDEQHYIKSAITREKFCGKNNEQLLYNFQVKNSIYKLMLVGLGKKDELDIHAYKKILGHTVLKVQSMKFSKVGYVISREMLGKSFYDPVKILVESIIQSCYKFSKYQKIEDRTFDIEDVSIFLPPNRLDSFNDSVRSGELSAKATVFAMDLVNEPAMVTTPSHLADIAREISKENKHVHVNVIDKEEAEKLGMFSYLGVARGSDEQPKFIILKYIPKAYKKTIILIGKGITFDTGGLSLKPSEHMETMKIDMSGAADVLAIFKYISEIKPTHKIVGIIPSCENMPSGKALKPGDILKAMDSHSIEVLNTDAEGRLTLADAFSYALKYENPDLMIDLATLTGACMVALGAKIAGLWGNDKYVVNAMLESAERAGEKLWHMPLEHEYKDLLKSHVADIKNVQTGKYGGAITAALFLEKFVGKVPWLHLDIAGPVFDVSENQNLYGATGYGVKTLIEFLQKYS